MATAEPKATAKKKTALAPEAAVATAEPKTTAKKKTAPRASSAAKPVFGPEVEQSLEDFLRERRTWQGEEEARIRERLRDFSPMSRPLRVCDTVTHLTGPRKGELAIVSEVGDAKIEVDDVWYDRSELRFEWY